jgi:ABC-type transporter lipoprotein component MlaA
VSEEEEQEQSMIHLRDIFTKTSNNSEKFIFIRELYLKLHKRDDEEDDEDDEEEEKKD